MSEAKFVGIFDKDVQESQTTPPELRWFMQDEEDRVFLRAAVVNVFQNPEAASKHAAAFYHACNARFES